MHLHENFEAHDLVQIDHLHSVAWLNRCKAIALLSLAVLPWPAGAILLKWLGAI
ncbi:hypothetical protein AA0N74_07870 [Chromobacterium vaccinii]|uniref:hypothetical protein n=1 Tax=Chromobacterium vaccinii TaxID=1108595 RepID=UPI0031D01478